MSQYRIPIKYTIRTHQITTITITKPREPGEPSPVSSSKLIHSPNPRQPYPAATREPRNNLSLQVYNLRKSDLWLQQDRPPGVLLRRLHARRRPLAQERADLLMVDRMGFDEMLTVPCC